jgi:hypothetical protein
MLHAVSFDSHFLALLLKANIPKAFEGRHVRNVRSWSIGSSWRRGQHDPLQAFVLLAIARPQHVRVIYTYHAGRESMPKMPPLDQPQ